MPTPFAQKPEVYQTGGRTFFFSSKSSPELVSMLLGMVGSSAAGSAASAPPSVAAAAARTASLAPCRATLGECVPRGAASTARRTRLGVAVPAAQERRQKSEVRTAAGAVQPCWTGPACYAVSMRKGLPCRVRAQGPAVQGACARAGRAGCVRKGLPCWVRAQGPAGCVPGRVRGLSCGLRRTEE